MRELKVLFLRCALLSIILTSAIILSNAVSARQNDKIADMFMDSISVEVTEIKRGSFEGILSSTVKE